MVKKGLCEIYENLAPRAPGLCVPSSLYAFVAIFAAGVFKERKNQWNFL